MVKITLKDGNEMMVDDNTTVLEVAEKISPGLARMAMSATFNDELVDIRKPLETDGVLDIHTFDSDDGKWAYRHTSAHILAQAVKRLWPEAKLAIGPAIDNGFYYDIDIDPPISEDDLEKIEKEMEKIIKEDLPLEYYELSKEEAIEFYKSIGEDYKVELIEGLPDGEIISFYRQGEFTDLCAGPHVKTTKDIKAVKLTSLAGAYWRGDEKNKMLTRIYGTSFPKRGALDEYLALIEEAKKRDHRKLGKELDIFVTLEEAPGMPFFMPNGVHIRNKLVAFWRELHKREKYHEISTPQILSKSLWEKSGHWTTYKENMYITEIDEKEYAIKPMNCPGANLLYKQKMWSYRDFPYRTSELGDVHRHELSGALHGLMRVRRFTQDDAHLYMTKDQITDEILGIIKLTVEMYKVFGFEYKIELSTKPEISIGIEEEWQEATDALSHALDIWGEPYEINEGDGAFYGPKIDFIVYDSLGRGWQCGTIQLDFQQPERFELEYVAEDGERYRPVMVHRTVLGSLERFMGILIEHYAGNFPLWLAPVHVRILPISEHVHEYAYDIERQLDELGFLVEVDDRSEKIGYKIREARNRRTPYMIIVGEKEKEEGTISLRSREQGDEGGTELSKLIERMTEEIETKRQPQF